MTRSVFANKRNFSHKGSGDKSVCSAPDVCKTPVGPSTPPLPYPVVSQAQDLSGGSSSVLIDGNSTALESSTHQSCSGDQAGTATGLISGTTGDKTHFASYSFDVKVEGEGVVRHMDLTTMNNRNTIGMNFGAVGQASENPDSDSSVDDMYTLRFVFHDELGQPIKNIAYKTLPEGDRTKLHEADGKSNMFGNTHICSTEKDESIDCFLVWQKFTSTEGKI
ncbi:hypothetical protein TDB9533_00185 [Thalassocella blandensis]|nr:hypothetical protein TDB9533_00185 [Thalassocella blandensis]